MKIALAGNPNSGKSSLFNQLTGLSQHVGNFPGVTIDKKTGHLALNDGQKATIIDLPGTYSLYPKSEEEKVVKDILTNPENPERPDLIIVTADATNLKRNLLLFSQIHDLGYPVILALNMMDVVKKRNKTIDLDKLSEQTDTTIIPINARTGTGVGELKALINNGNYKGNKKPFMELPHGDDDFINQREETLKRYELLDKVLQGVVTDPKVKTSPFTRKLDKIFTHKIFGYLILGILLFTVFQAIFFWAEWPMDLIDGSFSSLSSWLSEILPAGLLTNLLTEGIIPGISGIVIFIPQIAILFAFIGLLEESGYMARVVFLMDKIMSIFGLNGRSIVPLISGIACAVPAIMASRTISSKRDRLITILVTPFMSCSARLPVYTILIALVVPDQNLFGIINLKGLALFSLYLLGFIAALLASLVIKYFVKSKSPSYLIMEMPGYKIPRWSNLGISIFEKTRTFIFEAGKIIFAISIVLWFAASFGPGDSIQNAESAVLATAESNQWDESTLQTELASAKLKASYAGLFGKMLEPAIQPLGYDWKIGIALISSFAAREVFVGTIATIYSVGDAESELSIRGKLARETIPETGEKRFTPAVGFSLMIFYAFAMQCMSTIAVVYRETKGWKWPIIQLLMMTTVAYLSALLVYQIMK